MISKNKISHKSNADDLDYERINQLIARYSNICATPDDSKSASNYDVSSSRKKKELAASRNESGRNTGPLHTYPLKNDNYFYNIPSLSDSKKGQKRKYCPIEIICTDFEDSSISNDTDSSFSITSIKCSKEDLIASRSKQVKFQDYYKNVEQQTSFPTFPCTKSCAEKTTYCRPLRNSYDRRFLCKIMERNAKLQLLLTKYVITRQKEKEREKWNNYVNMIKIQNRFFRDSSKHFSSPSVAPKSADPLQINNFHNRKYNLHQSDSCRGMLQDLYDTSNELFPEYPDEYYDRKRYNDIALKRVYHSQQHCFPNTLRVKRNKRQGKPERSWSSHRSPMIVIDDESTSTKGSKQDQYLRPSPAEWFSAAKVYPRRANIFDMKQSRNAQTNITFGGNDDRGVRLENKSEPKLQTSSNNQIELDNNLIRAVGVINEVENIFTGNKKHDVTAGNVFDGSEVTQPKMSIHNLESKLDKLLDVFNSFIKDQMSITTKQKSHKLNESYVIMTDIDKDQNTLIDTHKEAKTKKRATIVGNVQTNTSFGALESQLTPSHYLLNMRLNKILYEELDKSNKIRSEIEAMLNPTTNQSCAVEIDVDVPTRERSTEVTDSLSKTKLKECRSEKITVEDISHVRSIPTQMQRRADQRIAVNTEPLGLLTLLRLSAEAVRQVLSFVPNLSWYLTSLHHPVSSSHDYVCNICGAAFARPSQLGAHILSHDLGQARDCSVCRHTVDSRRSSQLFRCPYCGQRFTRAYCCELHQQGCSRRLRNRHPSVECSRQLLR